MRATDMYVDAPPRTLRRSAHGRVLGHSLARRHLPCTRVLIHPRFLICASAGACVTLTRGLRSLARRPTLTKTGCAPHGGHDWTRFEQSHPSRRPLLSSAVRPSSPSRNLLFWSISASWGACSRRRCSASWRARGGIYAQTLLCKLEGVGRSGAYFSAESHGRPRSGARLRR